MFLLNPFQILNRKIAVFRDRVRQALAVLQTECPLVEFRFSGDRLRLVVRVKHKIAAFGDSAVEVGREHDVLHFVPS